MFNQFLGEYLDKAIIALSDFATCTEQFLANCESSKCIPLHPADIARMKYVEGLETEEKTEKDDKTTKPTGTAKSSKQKQTLLNQSSFLPSEKKPKAEKGANKEEPNKEEPKKVEEPKVTETPKIIPKETTPSSAELSQKDGEHSSHKKRHRHRKHE